MMRLRGLPYKYVVATVFVFGLFMDILDATVVNVALPTLGKDFHAGNTTLEWVVTGYLLSLAVWIPASGWLGDRFGTKKIFLFAMATFTLGSALCGFSQQYRSTDRLPYPARCGRRHDDAGRHGDALPGLPALRTGEGLGDPLDTDLNCARAGPDLRRLVGRRA